MMLGVFLLLGLLGGLIIFSPRSNNSVSYIMIILVSFIIIYGFILTKLSAKLAGSLWHIDFNDQTINISADKYQKKIHPILRLTVVELFNDHALLGKSLGIRMAFSKVVEDGIAFTDQFSFESSLFVFSGRTQQHNFAMFKQFIDALNQSVLQPDFKLIDTKDAHIMKLGKIMVRQPARASYFVKIAIGFLRKIASVWYYLTYV